MGLKDQLKNNTTVQPKNIGIMKQYTKKKQDTRLMIRINQQEKTLLENQSNKLNISVASLVRIAISEYMDKNNIY